MGTKEEIMESIEKMSVLELSELVKSLEEKFNVVAVAPVAVGGGGTQSGAQPAVAQEEEKTSFTVVLTNTGDKKIQVIKTVREVTSLGLKEAKDLVDGAPKPIKEGVTKEEAENIKKKFEGSGATIEIK